MGLDVMNRPNFLAGENLPDLFPITLDNAQVPKYEISTLQKAGRPSRTAFCFGSILRLSVYAAAKKAPVTATRPPNARAARLSAFCISVPSPRPANVSASVATEKPAK
jgi:hypothetical protein